MLVRRPHVAGSFYPSESAALRQFCKANLPPSRELSARAVILPHAGYIYSGQTACLVLSRVKVPELNLLIGPNHRGYGADFSLYDEGEWETPLGAVPIETAAAREMLAACPNLKKDCEAHADEHSLEVLVPFLQFKNPSVKILPVIAGTLNLERTREFAQALGNFLAARSETRLVVVSTDMSHYEDDRATRKKDQYALDAILNLDAESLVQAVKRHRITMCGFIPVVALLLMSEALGVRKTTLVDYRTSADATGDTDRVVGYAGFIFE